MALLGVEWGAVIVFGLSGSYDRVGPGPLLASSSFLQAVAPPLKGPSGLLLLGLELRGSVSFNSVWCCSACPRLQQEPEPLLALRLKLQNLAKAGGPEDQSPESGVRLVPGVTELTEATSRTWSIWQALQGSFPSLSLRLGGLGGSAF